MSNSGKSAGLGGWRRRLVWLGLLSLALIGAGYWLALQINGHARAELSFEQQQRAQAEQNLARLRSRLAIVERGTDVTGAANRRLREELAQMEHALQASRSDLEFYRRLLSAGLEKGLGVHEMRLSSTASQRVVRFELTLALNSRQPGPAKGKVTVSIHGISADQPRTLDLGALLPEDSAGRTAAALNYEFRYFQQLSGDLVLPSGFIPERLTVVVVPQGRAEPVEREFIWGELFQPKGDRL